MSIKGLLIILLFLFLLPNFVSAQDARTPKPFIPVIGSSQIAPASPFYFLKMVKEEVEWKLAQTDQVKLMRQMEFAIRRLREVKTLISEDREDLIEPNLIKYQDHLKKLGRYANGNKELELFVSDRVATQMNLLINLYPQLENNRAKLAVRATIENWERQNREELVKQEVGYQEKFWQKIALTEKLSCDFLQKEATNSSLVPSERYLINLKTEDCLEFLARFEVATSSAFPL